MAISGITVTPSNGVSQVTSDQNITGSGTADGECLHLTASGSLLRSSSTGSVVVTNGQVFLDADVGTGNDASAPINFGGRTITATEMAFRHCILLCGPFGARTNIQVTELSDCEVIEADDTGQMFCYTGTDAIVDTVRFRGTNTWEVYATPSVVFGVTLDTQNKPILNWEAGRLDLFNVAILNRPGGSVQADLWIGTGASDNAFHMWNPIDVNNQRLYLTAANNYYEDGYTATWAFTDAADFSAIQDALVIFRDDYSGSMATRGTFLTNSNGRMAGTFDSQFRTTGSSIERPTLFTIQNFIDTIDTGSPGAYTYPVSLITGDQGNRTANYDITPVETQVEVRAYLYNPPSGYVSGDTLDITAEIGQINSDLSVARYERFFMTKDPGVTETTKATVDAYSGLGNMDQLYDRTKAEWYDNDDYPLPTANGATMDLGTADLIVDGDAGAAFAYAAGPDEITINPVAAPVVTRIGATEAVSTGESDEIVIAFPGGIEDDDVAYIAVGHSQSDENAWNTPSGWTIPTGLTEVQAGGSPASVPGVSVFRRVLSSDSGSVTITNAGSNTSGIVAQMIVYRGVDTTTPEDVNPTTASGASGDPDPASITPSSDNSMILTFGFQDDGDQTAPTQPSGYTAILDTATPDGAGTGE